MAEILGQKFTVFQNLQTEAAKVVLPYFFMAGIKGQPVFNGCCAIGENEPLVICEGNVQPDIFFRRHGRSGRGKGRRYLRTKD